MTRFPMFSIAVLLSVTCLASPRLAAQASYIYGVQPGDAAVEVSASSIILRNAVLRAEWSISGEKLVRGSFAPSSADNVSLNNVFIVVFADGKAVKSSAMTIDGHPRRENLEARPSASRFEEHFAGKRAVVQLTDPASKLAATWSASLRDGDNFVRQELTFTCSTSCAIREIRLFDFKAPGATVVGSVKGSPVTLGNIFLGFENPLSRCTVENQEAKCFIDRELPLKPAQPVTYSSVIGVAPAGQMRRAFLNYLERERAHPYRPFLHYNSWFDIGYGNRYDQAAALDVISAFGQELHEKRGVQVESFLFDDGWDDPKSLWSFDAGFPNGFTPITAAAARYGAAPGIWLSPWGGYDKAKEERLKYGKQQGFETNKGGFALSGPKYFARFREVTLDFIRKYNINQFKIDGTGNVNSVFPKSEFDSDFHAAISLIQ